ncbi:hypothetical protein PF001_g30536, partial [Phytophthora fragariae]
MCAVRAISAVMFSGGGVVARTLSPHVAVALAAPFRTSIPSSPLVTTCTSVASGFPIASFPTGRLFIAAPRALILCCMCRRLLFVCSVRLRQKPLP